MSDLQTFLLKWVYDFIDMSRDGHYIEGLAKVESRLPVQYHQEFVDLLHEVLVTNYNLQFEELTLGTVTYEPRLPDRNKP